MKSFVILLVFVVRLKSGSASDPYDDQPKILVNDGNLIFESADSKDVRVKLKGSSKFIVNDVDILNTFYRQNNTAHLTPVNSEVFSTIMTQLQALQMTVRKQNTRIVRLETGIGNGNLSNSTFDRRRMTALWRRIRTLEVKVSNLTDKLTHNHCKSYPCMNGGTCFNMFDTFRCECLENWEGPTCNLDVNECSKYVGTDLGCQNGATCVNTVGSYECACTEGWKGKNCNRHKMDCLSVPQSEICGQGTCVQDNNKDGYSCICKQGWRQDNSTRACTQDVDECNEMRPHCSLDPKVICINTPGSFVCGPCPDGYTGNGFYCQDIDECQVNNGGCSISPKVECINTRGSSRCGNCPFGFEGDGKTCTATTATNSRPNSYQCSDSSICNVNALCYQYPNTPVNCICKVGYTGNGFGENGCIISSTYDPCASLFCSNGGTCMRNGTSAYCNCPTGTIGPNCLRENNLCIPNPCLNGGNCTQIRLGFRGRYRCSCLSGFTGVRCQTAPGCGGVLSDFNGTLKYPPAGGNYQHNAKCAWLIKTNLTKVLNITFKSFNLEASTAKDCRFDWLQIHDGRSAAAHIIDRFCGDTLPNGGNIISTHNSVYLWFRSDNSTSRDGFELTWDSIDPVCGGKFNISSHGTVASPGSPGNYPINSECEWHLLAAPGKRIQFLFYTLKIESHVNCSYDYLEIHSGASIETPSLGKFCNSTIPPPLLTPGNLATIHFHSDGDSNDAGFQIAYSVVEGIPGCGGIFTASKGDISSPLSVDDGKYKHNLLCDYVIRMPLGTRIRLEFVKFELEESAICKFDKLEIFEGLSASDESEEGLIGRYCGKVKPPVITSTTNVVTLKFTTDWSASEEGFQLNYKLICGGVYTAESGTISSPNYPNNYEGDRNCEYEIKAPMGKIIVLNILDLDIEQHSTCDFDYLQIFNGPYADNSTSLGRFCGDIKPDRFTSFASKQNVLLVHFTTDPSVFGRGFLANYTFVDVKCGGIIQDERDVIKPPMDTDANGFYQSNAKCQWLVFAPQGFVIQINILNFELEQDSTCKYDFIKIFNNGSADGEFIGPYCGTNIPKIITTTGNLATIVFQSDASTAKDGFTIGFNFIESSKLCGGNYFLQNGVLRTPGVTQYLPNKECEWILTVPNGQQIEIKFNYFDVEYHATCRFDGLEIRNGGSSLAPLVNKFCGDKIPPPFRSMSNQLYLKFYSDSSRAGRGFELEWDGTSFGCGGLLSQSKGAITSPNYPGTYPHNSQCEWRISVNEGSSIQIVFSDLDLEAHAECKYDYLELFDGSDASAKSFGKFCSSEHHPMHIETSGNHAMIRMSTDDSHAGRGFSIKYSTQCNRTIYADSGAIESPNFPEEYGNNIDCAWTIRVSKGNRVNMQFSHFALENDNIYHNETNEHICKYDYVSIYDYDYVEKDKKMHTLKTYCNAPPEIRNSTTDAVVVLFHTDTAAVDSGFRLEWYNQGCGGRLTHPRGNLLSPNFPKKYDHELICKWEITTNYGQSIEFTIDELDMERSESCQFDSLIFSHDNNFTDIVTKLCRPVHEPLVITTQGHKVFVKFESDESESSKGFNISYRTVDSVCGGSFSAPFGVIKTQEFPTKNYLNNQTCEWNIKTDPSHTLTFQLTDFDLERTINCSKDYLEITDPIFNEVLWKGCGNDKPNVTFTSKRNELTIKLVTDDTITAKGFVGNYSINCGSRVITNDSGEFVYRKSTNEGICHWTIIAEDPSKHVALTFTFINLFWAGNIDVCFGDISVFEGDIDSLGANRVTFCGSKVPPTVFSNGNALTVKLNTSSIATYGEFDIHYSVADNACGGNYKGMHAEFGSPNYPNTSPLNSFCVWKISSSEGNKVLLTIKDLNIEPTSNCNENYLEIRKENENGEVIGAFCGTEIPANIPSAAGYWLKFKTDDQTPNKGFFAEYKYLDLSELTGTSGIIQSPTYPKFVRRVLSNTYRITVKQGFLIRIEFSDFTMNIDEDDEDCYSYIKVYNGYDESAPAFDELCDDLPEPIISDSNVLFIKFLNSFNFKSRFQLSWNEIEKNITIIEANGTCAKNQVITFTSENEVFNITSPGYPHGYESNLDCEWTIVSALSSYRPVISFKNINLETLGECMADYVSVERTREDGTWVEVEKICEQDMDGYLQEKYKGTPGLKVKFHSDYNRNETGFDANVYLTCGGVFKEPEGIIEFNSTAARVFGFDCLWNVTVGRGRKIQFEFLQINIKNNSGTCDSNVIIRNGMDEGSPILGDGKYCGVTGAKIPQTSSNRAMVQYNAERSTGLNSFKLRYFEVQHECGGEIRLNSLITNATIFSPNYPNIPQPHIQCIWTIVGPKGQQIRIDFLERFDLARICSSEYVELRDGSTSASPILKTLCGDKLPDTFYSTSNMLRVKYFTDLSTPNDGFKARISVGGCGGLYRASMMSTEYLTSPKYPGEGAYPANTSCDYRIVAPMNTIFKINIIEIDLAEINTSSSSSSEELNENCFLNKDHLVIYSIMSGANSTNGESLVEVGKYCGKVPPKQQISALSNNILIRLQTFPRTSTLYKGFKLTYQTILSSCGAVLSSDSGIITSPGYPSQKLHITSCDWKITVKKGRRIKFEILDLDLIVSDERYTQRLVFYNDFKFRSRITQIGNSTNPGIFYSTDNMALISWYARVASNNRGFKIQYSSDERTLCDGDLSQSEGYIYEPSAENLTTFMCQYTRENTPIIPSSPNVGTIAFYFSDLFFESESINCQFWKDVITIRTESDPLTNIAVICQNETKKTVLSPWPDVNIMARQSTKYFPSNLKFKYSIHHKNHNCGGIMKGPGVIRNIPSQNVNYAVLDCAWSLKFENDANINLIVYNINLTLSCDKEYINVYNGETQTSPLIMKICSGSNKPIISQGSALFIEYHTDDFVGSSKNSVFELKAELNEFSCGGILHERTPEFKTPLVGNSYPPNTECVWELRANDGYHVGVEFVGRFFIEQSENCTKDYVEFYDFIDSDWVLLKRICGRDTPKPINSTSPRLRVIFRSDATGSGDGFNAIWNENCGGIIKVEERMKILSSPGYPNAYTQGLNCNYTFKSENDESFVNVKFIDFDLEDTGFNCFYDNITIFKKYDFTTGIGTQYNKVGTYCGKKNPGHFRSKSEILLWLRTDDSLNTKGFQLEYSLDKCGGWVRNTSLISSPKIIRSGNIYEYIGPLTCSWNISAPKDHHIAIRFERVNFQFSEYCSHEYVQVIKGSVDDDKNSLLRVCNNLTNSQLRTIHIEDSEAIVKMRVDQSQEYVGFSALVIFQKNCNEKFNLTKENPTKVLNKIGQNENNLDCAYQIAGEPMSVIKVTFNEMHLSDCHPNQNRSVCDCDYIEVLDGYGPFSSLIGRFCGHDVQREIFSTGSSMFIRFVTDATRPSNGFKLTFTMQESPCGSQPYYNFTNNENMTVSITSKLDSSSKYPSNIRCMYLFEAPYRSMFEIIFTKFDLEDSDNCTKDYLKIEDDMVKDYIVEGMGEEITYRGSSMYATSPNFYMGVTNPIGAHIYCGSTLPHEYISQSSKLRIFFSSDSSVEKSGFSLTVKTLNSCSRNYTALQGRLYSGTEPENCKMTITVPDDYTISLYFYRFFFMVNDCDKSSMKIYDGDFDSGALLETLCGYTQPNPIFSRGSLMSILSKYDNSTGVYTRGSYDIFYIASKKSNGPGCGGDIYNYGGYFTSPLYPNNNRTNFDCTWNVTVPQNLKVAMKFAVFDMGSKLTCENDYVEILEPNESREFVSIKRYCGGDTPAIFVSTSSQIKIHHKQTRNFAGNGWAINFMGVHEGATPQEW